MSISVGITGGIGSGKTLVCKIFRTLGIPVFNSDEVAKKLMVTDYSILDKLTAEFGEDTFLSNGELNRAYISELVFNKPERLKKLNNITHPAVWKASEEWHKSQSTPYTIKEAALLFESGSYQSLDKMILVTAPEDIRILRVISRDNTTEQRVRDRISKQMPDSEKIPLSDYILINDGSQSLIRQVLKLHHELLNLGL